MFFALSRYGAVGGLIKDLFSKEEHIKHFTF
jgi:hypothetical protein